MKHGTKVRILHQHSETGIIVRSCRGEDWFPSADWFLVRFDRDGACLCIHRSMLALSNGERVS